MIAPEVTDEFNLLENFLHASLLDDGAQMADALTGPSAPARPIPPPDMLPGFHNNNNNTPAAAGVQGQGGAMPPPPPADLAPRQAAGAGAGAPPGDSDKARREYYLQAADPSGNDTPEERMQRLLKAKYNAGMLKPFNYIKGYQRLSAYLDRTISTASKQKILRMLNQFRPKFREKAQALTDMELVIVEMWFEKQLLEYDRVFASMAVPACLWRRTGEVFRGNKEMAELIGVPVERLRDVSFPLSSPLLPFFAPTTMCFDDHLEGDRTCTDARRAASRSTRSSRRSPSCATGKSSRPSRSTRTTTRYSRRARSRGQTTRTTRPLSTALSRS